MTSQADRVAVGQQGWPSPISRCGPGIEGAIKPEIVAPGGTMALDERHVRRGGCRAWNSWFRRWGSSRFCHYQQLRNKFGHASCCTNRGGSSSTLSGCIIQSDPSSRPTSRRSRAFRPFIPEVPGIRADRRIARARRLIGFGEVRLDEAVRSQPNRAVLVAEDQIAIDAVHIYEVPIPSSFFETGGERSITVSLAYDPSTRSRRLDYLDSRMKIELPRIRSRNH